MNNENPLSPANPEDAIGAMPPDLRPLPAVLAVVGAAVGVVAVWAVAYQLGLDVRLAQLMPGVIVGCFVRFGARGAGRPMIFFAMACVLISQVAGYWWWDYLYWTPYMPGETLKRILSLTGVVLMAFNCYIMWLIAKR